jgi:hypothetical protein
MPLAEDNIRPGTRTTYTFAELEVSAAAYDEIAAKLREAGYDHAFVPARTEIQGVQTEREPAIDMHGIALTREEPKT